MLLMGIDVGSTSVKASVFKSEGQWVATSRKGYVIEEREDGWAEIDVDVYWESCVTVIREIIKALDERGESTSQLSALSVSSQRTTFVPVDSNGNPLCKAIVWMDKRAEKETQEIVNKIGLEKIFEITGQPDLNAVYMPPKLMWIRNNLAEVYGKTFKILCLEDYILFKLTGLFVTEYTIASMSAMLDIRKKIWWDEILNVIGFSRDKLPEILEPGKAIGKITRRAAEDTGLPDTITVATGAFDQVAAAVGVGNIKKGLVSESTGGVLALFATIDQPLAGNARNLPVMCHVQKDLYYFLPWCQSAGLTIRWLQRTFYPGPEKNDVEEANRKIFAELDSEASGISPGCDGLVMLPHLLGAGFPELNRMASGVFAGIRLRHTRAHFARALFEAMAFMLKRNVAGIESLGIEINEIRSAGGGSNAVLLNRIKADITEKVIRSFEVKDSGTLGCAILAGTAVGIYKSLEEGCGCTVKSMAGFEPDSVYKQIYEKNYKVYISLYGALKPVFREM